MNFVSFGYYVFLIGIVVLYYAVPLKQRYYVLLAGSMLFYFRAAEYHRLTLGIFLLMILMSYVGAIGMEWVNAAGNGFLRRTVLGCAVLAVLVPLLMVKSGVFLPTVSVVLSRSPDKIIVPLGISFFTMQMIAYLADVYQGKMAAQRNFLKYSLFISFFPQIIQGPIPRYGQLGEQLVEGHKFNEEKFTRGLHLIIWGFFLKLMIADKAAVVVNTVFGQSAMYKGTYVLVAGILYSIQLYTDFLSCVTLAQGAALLFGIKVADNFNHPYFSVSIKEFWGRWHISLSSWLRDYVYIPLGGNRKGTLRKYINLVITFAVSGIWHGWGFKYIVWGVIHAVYQMIGEQTSGIREKAYAYLGFEEKGRDKQAAKRAITFLLVMFAWIIFRAETLEEGSGMVLSVFTVYNPWVLFNDAIFSLGLSWKEWVVLVSSLWVLVKVSMLQERCSVSQWVISKPLVVRWGIYIMAILVIFVYGTYGFSFDAQDFIYGGF